jgi:hypothetical protein
MAWRDEPGGRASLEVAAIPAETSFLEGRPRLAILLSLLLHALIASLAWTGWTPLDGGRRRVLPAPEVLTFRFHEPTAEVTADSRVEVAPETPLLGRHASRARDRVRDERDTPVPAGRVGTDNALPGESGEADAPLLRPSPSAPGGGSPAAPPDPQGVRPSVVDALGSQTATLTGRRDEPRRGRTGQHAPEFGEGGALEFGDYAFSTKAWDYEPYWHFMRERLYANWHPPAGTRRCTRRASPP